MVNTPDFPQLPNDWIIPFVHQSSLSDTTPVLAKNSMYVLLRLFRTWPRMIVKEFQLPPIFHPSMTASDHCFPQPLPNCFTLARLWDYQSAEVPFIQETVLKETKRIFIDLQTYNEEQLLAALQRSHLHHSPHISLPRPKAIPAIDPSFFIGLQQVVYYTAGTGLILQEETEHTVPSWEAWIHVTSKRRAIFMLYTLHWAYSVYHRLPPTLNCDDLASMPALPAKFLWQASTREQWEGLYKRWLKQWDGCQYIQRKFLFIKPGLALDRRTQMWLEDADELGLMFLSIWHTTDREPEFMTQKHKW